MSGEKVITFSEMSFSLFLQIQSDTYVYAKIIIWKFCKDLLCIKHL